MKFKSFKINMLQVACVLIVASCSKKPEKAAVNTAVAVTQTIDCNLIPFVLEDLGSGVDYIIKCNILIRNKDVLTIKPGVTIQFEGQTSGITITENAALKMVGTADKPIILEGKIGTPSSWAGIQMSSENTENQWNYVTLQHAGGGKNPAGLLIDDNAYFLKSTLISIKNCTFNKNTGYGIWDLDKKFSYARAIFSAFENNVFTDNSAAALNLTIDGIGKLDSKSHYSQNGQKYIIVQALGGLHTNIVVQKLDVPYLIFGSISLHKKMTVLPGVTMQFFTDAGFSLGYGTLIANGNAANPIKFIGHQSGKGVWLGLSLGNNDPEILLNYCIIDGAGSNIPNASTACVGNKKGAVNFFPSCNNWTTKPKISNSTISNCGGYGIIYKKGMTTSFTNISYSNNNLSNEISF